MKEILVLYYSKNGSTKKLANYIARGINSIEGASARIRTVPEVSTSPKTFAATCEASDLYVTHDDLIECIGLALGSPVRFGNMASSLKYFLDNTTHEWLSGTLTGKAACVFTSSGSLHGGQEACLWTMLVPLLHHGMIIVGLPYTDSALMNTKTGGTPYGVSHHSGINDDMIISTDEKNLAILQGKLLAITSLKLAK
ncbi:MAG: NAD(P)H:quinone oxidoreductase [Burkholderiales bacterium]|nr:NAD(P)H:quinone oxidoreductase [Burkholderiales bacterium]